MQPAQPSPDVTWSLTAGAGCRFSGEAVAPFPGQATPR